MVDVSAINSTICYLIRQPKDLINEYKRARRISLENLALALIKYGIKWRIDVRSINNFTGIKSHVKNAIIKSGESICNIRSPSPKKNWKRRNIVICAIERKKILAKTGTNTK